MGAEGPNMPLLVCHIGWMNLYEGLARKPDKIVGGGSYVQENELGAEVCNFLHCKDGNVYGYVETFKDEYDRPIRIELLGASKSATFVDGVDVLWTATHPTERGRRVIGWYRNARVFRERQAFRKQPSPQHRRDELRSFRVRARSTDAVLIPLDERTLKLGHGKGWIGQANWWFPEASKNTQVRKFVARVRSLMSSNTQITVVGRTASRKGRWGGNSDVARKALVEKAAIDVVSAHYDEYEVTSVEKENRGWDLEASKKGSSTLRLEVKGLSGVNLQIGLTPREYEAFKNHINGEMDNYRLCIVTKALSQRPTLAIFRFLRDGWLNEYNGREISPTITPKEAAIITL